MKREQWDRVAAEFDAICDLPESKRDEVLRALEREDEAVAGELRAMLAADSRESGALEAGPFALAADDDLAEPGVAVEPPTDRVGTGTGPGPRRRLDKP